MLIATPVDSATASAKTSEIPILPVATNTVSRQVRTVFTASTGLCLPAKSFVSAKVALHYNDGLKMT